MTHERITSVKLFLILGLVKGGSPTLSYWVHLGFLWFGVYMMYFVLVIIITAMYFSLTSLHAVSGA